jgi:hypothetical protein
MANLKSGYSSYIRFYLISETKPALLVENVIGWNEFGVDCARNLVFHGTLTEVTKTLGFTKEAREYILSEFKENDVLGKMTLIVERLLDKDNEVKWVKENPVYADFYTIDRNDSSILSISFNSNNLMDKIDSYEDEEFEIERLEDYDNKTLTSMTPSKIDLEGRSLVSIGEQRVIQGYFIDQSGNEVTYTEDYNGSSGPWTIETEIVSQGPPRNSTVNVKSLGSITASNMIYVESSETVGQVAITLNYSIVGEAKTVSPTPGENLIELVKYQYNVGTASYDEIESFAILVESGQSSQFVVVKNNSISTFVEENQGLLIRFTNSIQFKASKYRLRVFEVEEYEQSFNLNFHFISDVIDRLIYIVTGKSNLLNSDVLGRTEKGYSQDGKYGLIAMISGFQARAFDVYSEKYKSPKISIKNALSSICNVFNLGAGVEVIDNKEVLTIEEFEYFYRQEIVGSFKFKIDNHKRIVDSKHYYSGISVGFEKGGEYANQMGLDEPNVKSQFITPIYNSTNKFDKLSNIRADEYGLEDLRRKPQLKFANVSVKGDEDNWFMDLKRSLIEGKIFEQVSWQDRLEEEPTGIYSPETFRSMIFSPMRSLLRLAQNFKSGLYIYKEKYINFTSSSSNRTLEMKFIGEDKSYKESDNVKIGDLKRPIFKNEILKFTHPYSEEVREMLFGKTKVTINGVEKLIPNFYFKFEWINENNEIERGYFLKYEYEDNPTFEFQIANEEIL